MDPVTGALFAAASFATSVIGNRSRAKAEQASIRLETEQAKLQAAESSLERTKLYRQNVSMNLAMSGMGVGAVNAFAATEAESFANYMADINAIKQTSNFMVMTGEAKKSLSKSNQFSANVDALKSAAGLASDLGLFAPPAKKGK